jgi:hypothetical protein
VVERLATLLRRNDGYLEVFFVFVLPDEVFKRMGAETGIERRVLGAGLTRDDASYSLTPST